MTPKMRAALAALVDLTREEYDAFTPNRIGQRMGQAPGHLGGGRSRGTGGGHVRRTGPGSGISSVLRALERDGLIHWTTRPDGLSGVAYYLTPAGRAAAASGEDPTTEPSSRA